MVVVRWCSSRWADGAREPLGRHGAKSDYDIMGGGAKAAFGHQALGLRYCVTTLLKNLRRAHSVSFGSNDPIIEYSSQSVAFTVHGRRGLPSLIHV
jgi:hypothetical protein